MKRVYNLIIIWNVNLIKKTGVSNNLIVYNLIIIWNVNKFFDDMYEAEFPVYNLIIIWNVNGVGNLFKKGKK